MIFNKYKKEIENLKYELKQAKEREANLLNQIKQSSQQGTYKTSLYCNGCLNLSHVCSNNTELPLEYIHYCKLNNPCDKYKSKN